MMPEDGLGGRPPRGPRPRHPTRPAAADPEGARPVRL
jgi:hypothetical protein